MPSRKTFSLKVHRYSDDAVGVEVLIDGRRSGFTRFPPLGDAALRKLVAEALERKLTDLSKVIGKCWDRLESRGPTSDLEDE